MKTKITFYLLMGMFLPISMHAQTILIQQPGPEAGKDAMIGNYFTYVDMNFGTLPELHAWAWTAEGINTDMRFLLQFDLSSIPEGSIINDAKLSLYHDTETWWGGGEHSGDNAAYFSRVTEPWDEMTVTWNNQPATTIVHRITLDESASPEQNYHINVKQLIQDMVNDPENSYGFYMQLIDEDPYNSLLFCSSDNATVSKRPKLRISYTTPARITAETNAVSVSPNPFVESFTVHFDGASENGYTFEMYNIAGEVMYRAEHIMSDHIVIERNNMPSGIYMYQVSNGNEVVHTGKMIAQ